MLSVTTPALNFTSRRGRAQAVRASATITPRSWSPTIPDGSAALPMLPLTDTEGSLQEIDYALDTLKADGIGADDELRRQMARRSLVSAGDGRTQPAQGCRLHPSDRSQLLRQSGPHPAAGHDRIRHRYDAHHRRHRLQRQRTEVSRHQLDILACRRNDAVPDRALRPQSAAGSEGEGDGAGRNPGRTQALLLRHRADLEQGVDVGALGHHSGVADPVRHRFPVSDQHRPREGACARRGCSPTSRSPPSSAATRSSCCRGWRANPRHRT